VTLTVFLRGIIAMGSFILTRQNDASSEEPDL
jgi:hypothetical protein